ncbi:MAG: hypothetical protein NC217_06875 [Muribaculaceae bacterium]|nr:hypothetical protein [Muribaculaceae bacterium]
MLKTQLRVSIRLFCLIATFLALTLPARAWTAYYLTGDTPGWCSYQEQYKFTDNNGTYSLTVPGKLEGKWHIDGYYSATDHCHYGPNESEYGFHDNWTKDSNTAVENKDESWTNGWKITYGDNYNVFSTTITFTIVNSKPKDITFSYKKWDIDPYYYLDLRDCTWFHSKNTTPYVWDGANNIKCELVEGEQYVYKFKITNSNAADIYIKSAESNYKEIKAQGISAPNNCFKVNSDFNSYDATVYTEKVVPVFKLEYGKDANYLDMDCSEESIDNVYTYTVTVPKYSTDNGSNWFMAYGVSGLGNNNNKRFGARADNLRSDAKDGINEVFSATTVNAYRINNKSNENDLTLTFEWNMESKTLTLVKAELHSKYDIARGYPRVYLLGNALNDEEPSPEWRMTKVGDNKYSLKNFALRPLKYRKEKGNELIDGGKYTVRFYYNAETFDDKEFTEDILGSAWKDMGAGYPGWGADATFTFSLSETTNRVDNTSLSFVPTNGKTEWNQTVLPYVGILGENFMQETEYKTKLGNTSKKWQEAYIQYDADGNPVVSNGKAYYNTVWPPKNDILMVSKTANDEITTSTASTTFVPELSEGANVNDQTPLIKTGSEWQKLLTDRDNEMYSGLSLNGDNKYIRYHCDNPWIAGQFKIWTGWGGQQGTWGSTTAAMWNNHLYFSSDLADNDNKGNVQIQKVEAKNQYNASNGLNKANFNLDEPTFFKTVDLFIPVNDNGMPFGGSGAENSDARLYFGTGKLNASIRAKKETNNDTQVTNGLYNPTVSGIGTWQIKSVNVVRADYKSISEGEANWKPVTADYELTSEADATVFTWTATDGKYIETDQAFEELFTNVAYENGWIKDENLGVGTYFYYLKIEAVNGDKTEIEIVPSNHIAVRDHSYVTEVVLYQLVKEVGTDNYVTYKKNARNAYNVKIENGVIVDVEERASVPTSNFYSDASKSLWTSYIAAAAYMPKNFATDDAIIKTPTEFTINYNGETVADVLPQAKADAAASEYGNRYLALLDFNNLADFDKNWTATFAAKLTETDNSTSVPEVTAKSSTLPLTMPAYGIDKVLFEVTSNEGTKAVEFVDDNVIAGEDTHTHTLQDAYVNNLDVKVLFSKPNIDAAVSDAYYKAIAGKTLTVEGVGSYELTFNKSEGDAYITLTNQDPNKWITVEGNEWKGKDVKFSLSGDNFNSSHSALQVYGTPKAEVTAAMYAKQASLDTYPMQGARIKASIGENSFEERVFMKKSQLELSNSSIRSALGNSESDCVALTNNDNNGTHEYLLLKDKDGKAIIVNYIANDYDATHASTLSEPAEKQHYHKYGELEKDNNLLLVAVSQPGTWYSGMDSDAWISKEDIVASAPKMVIANFFEGGSSIASNGVSTTTSELAPLADTNAEKVYVLYAGEAGASAENTDVTTSVDEVIATEAFVTAGNGWFEILTDGVTVYDLNGIAIATTTGRYEAAQGVYMAVKDRSAVKLYVK